MKIGIIGSGNIGSALTHLFTKAGHDVSIANSRGPESLADLGKSTGAHPATADTVARNNDVVVVTIPLVKVSSLAADLFAHAPAGQIVIDTCNYYPQQRDGRIDGIETGMTESQWVEQQIGHPVIKVFNNIMAEHLLNAGKPKGTPNRIALPIAGDDAKAKNEVMRLVDEIGFDTVDTGTIKDSWRQQPGSPVYGKDYDADGVRDALAKAQMERTPEWSVSAASKGA